jgi:hypothetical protein
MRLCVIFFIFFKTKCIQNTSDMTKIITIRKEPKIESGEAVDFIPEQDSEDNFESEQVFRVKKTVASKKKKDDCVDELFNNVKDTSREKEGKVCLLEIKRYYQIHDCIDNGVNFHLHEHMHKHQEAPLPLKRKTNKPKKRTN